MDADPAAPAPTTEAQIEEWARLQFLPEQIALALDLPPEEAEVRMDTPTDPWGVAYLRGQLKGEAEVRAAVYRGATQGSTQAQAAFEKYVDARQKRERGER